MNVNPSPAAPPPDEASNVEVLAEAKRLHRASIIKTAVIWSLILLPTALIIHKPQVVSPALILLVLVAAMEARASVAENRVTTLQRWLLQKRYAVLLPPIRYNDDQMIQRHHPAHRLWKFRRFALYSRLVPPVALVAGLVFASSARAHLTIWDLMVPVETFWAALVLYRTAISKANAELIRSMCEGDETLISDLQRLYPTIFDQMVAPPPGEYLQMDRRRVPLGPFFNLFDTLATFSVGMLLFLVFDAGPNPVQIVFGVMMAGLQCLVMVTANTAENLARPVYLRERGEAAWRVWQSYL